MANRAALPLALVELGEYLDGCIDSLKPYNPAGNTNERIQKDANWLSPDLPKFPYEANSILRSCIETSDTAQMKSLFDLVALLQIQNSRFCSFFKGIGHQSSMVVVTENLNCRIIEAAQLATMSANIFDYARLRKEEIQDVLPAGSIAMRLFSSRVLEEEFPNLYEALRQGRGLLKLN